MELMIYLIQKLSTFQTSKMRIIIILGLVFIPNISRHIFTHGRMTTFADAAHFQGFVPQSYGTTIVYIVHDKKNHTMPKYFGHYVGSECSEIWKELFQSVAQIDGLYVDNRAAFLDQKKIIDSSYQSTMKKSHIFLGMLHVKKNISSAIWGKTNGFHLHERSVRAPAIFTTDYLKEQFGPNQAVCISKLKN